MPLWSGRACVSPTVNITLGIKRTGCPATLAGGPSGTALVTVRESAGAGLQVSALTATELMNSPNLDFGVQ